MERSWSGEHSFFQDDERAFLAGAVAYQVFFALLPFLLLVVGSALIALLGAEIIKAHAARRAQGPAT